MTCVSRVSLVAVAMTLLWLVIFVHGGAAAIVPDEETRARFENANIIRTVQDYAGAVNQHDTAVLCVVFDDTNQVTVNEVWGPLVRQLASNLGALSINVVYATANSEIGEVLLNKMLAGTGGNNALLFYNGILRPVGQEVQGLTKVPEVYTGTLNSELIMQWTLQAISAEALHLIENDADLVDFFGLYPGYQDIGRVLYFTDVEEIGPVYKILSQQFVGDAVFGVVHRPLSTPEKASIAKRYNVTTVPAILVMLPDPRHDGYDLVHTLDGIAPTMVIEELRALIADALPQSTVHLVMEAKRTNNQNPYIHAQQRKVYMYKELNMAHEQLQDALRDSLLDMPIVATTPKTWNDLCVNLLPQYACLVGVAADQDHVAHVKDTIQTAARRLFSTFSDIAPQQVHRVIIDAKTSPKLASFFGAGRNGFPHVFLLENRPGEGFFYHTFAGAFAPDRIANFAATRVTVQNGGTAYDPHKMPSLFAGGPLYHNDDDDGDL